MDQRERHNDPQLALSAALSGLQSGIWTALPGEIQSFNPAALTCVVQPTIKGQVQDQYGNFTSVAMPLLLDCPVFFPAGGGCTLTFPLTKGDECLVVFASRCIDSWWQSGGVQERAEYRMHDLSDGFVFAGVRSQPRVLGSVSTSTTQLRTDDGAAYIEVNPANHAIKLKTSGNADVNVGGNLTAEAAGNITMTAPQITLNGAVTINGPLNQGTGSAGGGATLLGPLAVSNDVTAGGKSLKTHTHGGVQPGSGNTGAPN